MRGARPAVTASGRADGAASAAFSRAVTLSNENRSSRYRPCPHPPATASGGHEPSMGRRRATARQGAGTGRRPRLAVHQAAPTPTPTA